jgi:integrase
MVLAVKAEIMRMKDYDDRSGKRVWLSESELQLLLDHTDTDHPEMDIALLLAARCGLRRREIVDVTPTDLVSTDHGQVVRVWEGKGDKYREVPAPDELPQIVLGLGREPDEPLVSVADSTIYDWVKRARERAHAESGDEGWLYVGPHDLRRSWGVRLLEAGVLPSVVMEWGGWEDWQTFRNHYLAEFSPEALRRERGKISWLAGGVPGERGGNPGYGVVDSSSKPF